MCGRLVNLDTVARVLAEYYHIKTDTQLAALNEALSRVPTETVGDSHKKDHVADPGNMVGDTISRAAAINAICEDGTQLERQGQYTMTMAERKQRDADILDALPSAQPGTARRIVGKSRNGMTLWYQCDMCNEPVDAQDNFCRGCGRRLTDG